MIYAAISRGSLGGHEVPASTKGIFIIIQGVTFEIIVPTHGDFPDLYIANVDQFLQRAIDNDKFPFSALGIHSISSTAAASAIQTLSPVPLRIQQETLGQGAFAVVTKYWDVSTGVEYAYKEPLNINKYDKDLWRKEISIMKRISHVVS